MVSIDDIVREIKEIVNDEGVPYMQVRLAQTHLGRDSVRISDARKHKGELELFAYILDHDGLRETTEELVDDCGECVSEDFVRDCVMDEYGDDDFVEDIIQDEIASYSREQIPKEPEWLWIPQKEFDWFYGQFQGLIEQHKSIAEELIAAVNKVPEEYLDMLETPYGGEVAFKGSSQYLTVAQVRQNKNGTVSAYGVLMNAYGDTIDADAMPSEEEQQEWYLLQPSVAERLLDEAYELCEQFGEKDK